jgi:hypothetical protein
MRQQRQSLVAAVVPVYPTYTQTPPSIYVCDPYAAGAFSYEYSEPDRYSVPVYAASGGDVSYTSSNEPYGTKQSGAIPFDGVGPQYDVSGANAVKVSQMVRDAVSAIYENGAQYTTFQPSARDDVITLRTNELRRAAGDFTQHTIVITVNSQQQELEMDVYSELFSKQGSARVAIPGGAPPSVPQKIVEALQSAVRGKTHVDITP